MQGTLIFIQCVDWCPFYFVKLGCIQMTVPEKIERTIYKGLFMDEK